MTASANTAAACLAQTVDVVKHGATKGFAPVHIASGWCSRNTIAFNIAKF